MRFKGRRILKALGALLFFAIVVGGPARAQIPGDLQESFTCPAANCKTVCTSLNGLQTFTGYKELDAYMVHQPDRLWLQMDKNRTVVLGVGDQCQFEGAAQVIQQQPTKSDLGPPPQPGKVCITIPGRPPRCN